MKTIFITGAASGIGKATALLFAEKGWFVGLYDVDAVGLKTLSQIIGEGRCCFDTLDVAESESVRKAMGHFTSNTGGRIDVLFNNAGILRVGFFSELTLEEQIREVDVNLKGVLNCTHAAIPFLKKSSDARVINMSSASAIYGTAHLAVYSATKAAVSSLTESLNMELERHNIHVSDIRVPYVHTPLLETKTKAASLQTMGTTLVPEDVAAMVHASLGCRKIHNEGKGMMPLLMLRRLAPMIVQKFILKFIMMPK
jgi:NAD(P)-dependent dehydrogenase (short-subunit alcohol dehydrogenase family)